MTGAEYSIKKLIKKKQEINRLYNEIEEIESNLHGMEFKYEGHYAIVEIVDSGDQMVRVYVEEEEGYSYHVALHFSELLSIISK